MQHLKNLTRASAKHLLNQGHITQQHHDRIVNTTTGQTAAREMRGMERMAKRKQPHGFGSLAAQAQAPIPSTDNGPGTIPAGTASGY
jgi:hypothetical protein